MALWSLCQIRWIDAKDLIGAKAETASDQMIEAYCKLTAWYVFNDGATRFAAVPGIAGCADDLEVIVFFAGGRQTFRAVPPLERVGLEGQMTVPAAQPLIVLRKQ